VDKIIIAQESVAKLVNDIRPGAYTSMTKVRDPTLRATFTKRNMSCSQIDFKTLDTCDLKPIGVYGSISAIVDFLLKAKCVEDEMYCESLVPKFVLTFHLVLDSFWLLAARKEMPSSPCFALASTF